MTHSIYLFLPLLLFGILNFARLAYGKVDDSDSGCLCKGYSCGCCLYIDLPEIGLNDSACVNITYLPKEYGIHFTMNIDKVFIYNETISARSPPPLCAGAPFLEEFAELCVHFYDLDATLSKLHGCVDLEGRLRTVVVARYDLGCFNIGGINPANKNAKKWKKQHSNLIDRIRGSIGI